MSEQERDFSDDGFVSGTGLASKASARLSQGVAGGIGLVSGDKAKSHDLFVPPHDLNSRGGNISNSFKKLPSGRVAIADIESEDFEPGWGSETKPRSQREIFLSEQAFAEGKKTGELEARKIALEDGRREGRESGYKDGFAAGSKERAGEVESRAQEIAVQHNDKRIEKIALFLGELMEVEKEATKRRDTELMTLMIAIFEKTLPALAEANGEQEVQFFLDSILKRFEDIPQITITLSDQSQDLVSRLREQVEVFLSSDKSIDTLVSFRFSSDLGFSDCRIAWAEGEVERRFSELWGEVKNALERHLPEGQKQRQKKEQKIVVSPKASPQDEERVEDILSNEESSKVMQEQTDER